MLTEEALRERKWAAYPALRKVLEGKNLPAGFYGLTSIHDTLPAEMDRLLEIAALVQAYQNQIQDSAREVGTEAIFEDLRSLCGAAEAMQAHFGRVREQVENVLTSLWDQLRVERRSRT